MGNFFELIQQFNQFKTMLEKSKQNPMELLNSELKKRNLSDQEIKDLIENAKSLKKLFGVN